MKTNRTPDTLTPASLADLASFEGRPCLSLYQPTHRRHPDNQQDPIKFRHLVGALETSLRQQHASDAVKALVGPFEALAQDHDFWNHTQDGLAVVADSFHTKPLRQALQSVERYQVLALSRHSVQLFEGNRHALDAVALAPGVPQTLSAVPGYERSEPRTSVLSHGGIGGGHVAMHDGQGGKKDAIDIDTERFFRAVDRAMLEHHSRPSGLPLMLAALPEHHHLFREISHNPFLMASGLMVNPQGLTPADLRQRAWEVAAPQQQAQQAAWSDAYAAAAGKGMGSEDLAQVTCAAVAGRVGTLLIEADRELAGRIDAATGRIDPAEMANPRVGDVLDDLSALVEKMGGQVHVLPVDRMPTRTGVAASFRH